MHAIQCKIYFEFSKPRNMQYIRQISVLCRVFTGLASYYEKVYSYRIWKMYKNLCVKPDSMFNKNIVSKRLHMQMHCNLIRRLVKILQSHLVLFTLKTFRNKMLFFLFVSQIRYACPNTYTYLFTYIQWL